MDFSGPQSPPKHSGQAGEAPPTEHSEDKCEKKLLVGELVEVRQKEVGLRGSWHPAVVTKEKYGRRLVQYDELLMQDSSQKLQESVPVGRGVDGVNRNSSRHVGTSCRQTSGARVQLRPRPPRVAEDCVLDWTAGASVEMQYQDAWWEGVLLEDADVADEEGEVLVAFLDEGEEQTVPLKELRVALEWSEETGAWSRREKVDPVLVLQQIKKKKELAARKAASLNGKMLGRSNPDAATVISGCGVDSRMLELPELPSTGYDSVGRIHAQAGGSQEPFGHGEGGALGRVAFGGGMDVRQSPPSPLSSALQGGGQAPVDAGSAGKASMSYTDMLNHELGKGRALWSSTNNSGAEEAKTDPRGQEQPCSTFGSFGSLPEPSAADLLAIDSIPMDFVMNDDDELKGLAPLSSSRHPGVGEGGLGAPPVPWGMEGGHGSKAAPLRGAVPGDLGAVGDAGWLAAGPEGLLNFRSAPGAANHGCSLEDLTHHVDPDALFAGLPPVEAGTPLHHHHQAGRRPRGRPRKDRPAAAEVLQGAPPAAAAAAELGKGQVESSFDLVDLPAEAFGSAESLPGGQSGSEAGGHSPLWGPAWKGIVMPPGADLTASPSGSAALGAHFDYQLLDEPSPLWGGPELDSRVHHVVPCAAKEPAGGAGIAGAASMTAPFLSAWGAAPDANLGAAGTTPSGWEYNIHGGHARRANGAAAGQRYHEEQLSGPSGRRSREPNEGLKVSARRGSAGGHGGLLGEDAQAQALSAAAAAAGELIRRRRRDKGHGGAAAAAAAKPSPRMNNVREKMRPSGVLAGRNDMYYCSPQGQRVTSLAKALAILRGEVEAEAGNLLGIRKRKRPAHLVEDEDSGGGAVGVAGSREGQACRKSMGNGGILSGGGGGIRGALSEARMDDLKKSGAAGHHRAGGSGSGSGSSKQQTPPAAEFACTGPAPPQGPKVRRKKLDRINPVNRRHKNQAEAVPGGAKNVLLQQLHRQSSEGAADAGLLSRGRGKKLKKPLVVDLAAASTAPPPPPLLAKANVRGSARVRQLRVRAAPDTTAAAAGAVADDCAKSPPGTSSSQQQERHFNGPLLSADGVGGPAHARRSVIVRLMEAGVLVEGEELKYMSKKDGSVLRAGVVSWDGIRCRCCERCFALSEFETHSGSTARRPAANIFRADGVSLAQCQNMAGVSSYSVHLEPRGSAQLQEVEVDYSDDVCRVCGDGGELICCDACPATFHFKCIGIEDVPEGDWFCPSCRCTICGGSQFDPDGFGANTVMLCDQCEREYHVACLQDRGIARLTNLPDGTWFCNRDCEKIHTSLRSLVGKSQPLDDGFSWMIVRYSEEDEQEEAAEAHDAPPPPPMFAPAADGAKTAAAAEAEHARKLRSSLAVMHECFHPIKDARTQEDMIPSLLFSRQTATGDYRGFYTMLLEKGGDLITAATVRVFGSKVAEMPLIGTRFQFRRKGMCRRLVNAIEQLLAGLGVEKLVLPAVPDVLATWTGAFGFQAMEDREKRSLAELGVLVFPGASTLEKHLLLPPPPGVLPSSCAVRDVRGDVGDDGREEVPLVLLLPEAAGPSATTSVQCQARQLALQRLAEAQAQGPEVPVAVAFWGLPWEKVDWRRVPEMPAYVDSLPLPVKDESGKVANDVAKPAEGPVAAELALVEPGQAGSGSRPSDAARHPLPQVAEGTCEAAPHPAQEDCHSPPGVAAPSHHDDNDAKPGLLLALTLGLGGTLASPEAETDWEGQQQAAPKTPDPDAPGPARKTLSLEQTKISVAEAIAASEGEAAASEDKNGLAVTADVAADVDTRPGASRADPNTLVTSLGGPSQSEGDAEVVAPANATHAAVDAVIALDANVDTEASSKREEDQRVTAPADEVAAAATADTRQASASSLSLLADAYGEPDVDGTPCPSPGRVRLAEARLEGMAAEGKGSGAARGQAAPSLPLPPPPPPLPPPPLAAGSEHRGMGRPCVSGETESVADDTKGPGGVDRGGATGVAVAAAAVEEETRPARQPAGGTEHVAAPAAVREGQAAPEQAGQVAARQKGEHVCEIALVAGTSCDAAGITELPPLTESISPSAKPQTRLGGGGLEEALQDDGVAGPSACTAGPDVQGEDGQPGGNHRAELAAEQRRGPTQAEGADGGAAGGHMQVLPVPPRAATAAAEAVAGAAAASDVAEQARASSSMPPVSVAAVALAPVAAAPAVAAEVAEVETFDLEDVEELSELGLHFAAAVELFGYDSLARDVPVEVLPETLVKTGGSKKGPRKGQVAGGRRERSASMARSLSKRRRTGLESFSAMACAGVDASASVVGLCDPGDISEALAFRDAFAPQISATDVLPPLDGVDDVIENGACVGQVLGGLARPWKLRVRDRRPWQSFGERERQLEEGLLLSPPPGGVASPSFRQLSSFYASETGAPDTDDDDGLLLASLQQQGTSGEGTRYASRDRGYRSSAHRHLTGSVAGGGSHGHGHGGPHARRAAAGASASKLAYAGAGASFRSPDGRSAGCGSPPILLADGHLEGLDAALSGRKVGSLGGLGSPGGVGGIPAKRRSNLTQRVVLSMSSPAMHHHHQQHASPGFLQHHHREGSGPDHDGAAARQQHHPKKPDHLDIDVYKEKSVVMGTTRSQRQVKASSWVAAAMRELVKDSSRSSTKGSAGAGGTPGVAAGGTPTSNVAAPAVPSPKPQPSPAPQGVGEPKRGGLGEGPAASPVAAAAAGAGAAGLLRQSSSKQGKSTPAGKSLKPAVSMLVTKRKGKGKKGRLSVVLKLSSRRPGDGPGAIETWVAGREKEEARVDVEAEALGGGAHPVAAEAAAVAAPAASTAAAAAAAAAAAPSFAAPNVVDDTVVAAAAAVAAGPGLLGAGKVRPAKVAPLVMQMRKSKKRGRPSREASALLAATPAAPAASAAPVPAAAAAPAAPAPAAAAPVPGPSDPAPAPAPAAAQQAPVVGMEGGGGAPGGVLEMPAKKKSHKKKLKNIAKGEQQGQQPQTRRQRLLRGQEQPTPAPAPPPPSGAGPAAAEAPGGVSVTNAAGTGAAFGVDLGAAAAALPTEGKRLNGVVSKPEIAGASRSEGAEGGRGGGGGGAGGAKKMKLNKLAVHEGDAAAAAAAVAAVPVGANPERPRKGKKKGSTRARDVFAAQRVVKLKSERAKERRQLQQQHRRRQQRYHLLPVSHEVPFAADAVSLVAGGVEACTDAGPAGAANGSGRPLQPAAPKRVRKSRDGLLLLPLPLPGGTSAGTPEARATRLRVKKGEAALASPLGVLGSPPGGPAAASLSPGLLLPAAPPAAAPPADIPAVHGPADAGEGVGVLDGSDSGGNDDESELEVHYSIGGQEIYLTYTKDDGGQWVVGHRETAASAACGAASAGEHAGDSDPYDILPDTVGPPRLANGEVLHLAGGRGAGGLMRLGSHRSMQSGGAGSSGGGSLSLDGGKGWVRGYGAHGAPWGAFAEPPAGGEDECGTDNWAVVPSGAMRAARTDGPFALWGKVGVGMGAEEEEEEAPHVEAGTAGADGSAAPLIPHVLVGSDGLPVLRCEEMLGFSGDLVSACSLQPVPPLPPGGSASAVGASASAGAGVAVGPGLVQALRVPKPEPAEADVADDRGTLPLQDACPEATAPVAEPPADPGTKVYVRRKSLSRRDSSLQDLKVVRPPVASGAGVKSGAELATGGDGLALGSLPGRAEGLGGAAAAATAAAAAASTAANVTVANDGTERGNELLWASLKWGLPLPLAWDHHRAVLERSLTGAHALLVLVQKPVVGGRRKHHRTRGDTQPLEFVLLPANTQVRASAIKAK
eukprot:jgi/Mesen1/1982/ME000147S01076